MASYYVVDYENVGMNGLKGYETVIKEHDSVAIFYSDNSSSCIPIDFVRHCNKVGCPIKCGKCEKTGKNYLDFQLAAFVGCRRADNGLSSDNIIYIISKDKGYQAVVDLFGEAHVQIKESIGDCCIAKDSFSEKFAQVREDMTNNKDAKPKEPEKLTSELPEYIPQSYQQDLEIALDHINLDYPLIMDYIMDLMKKSKNHKQFLSNMKNHHYPIIHSNYQKIYNHVQNVFGSYNRYRKKLERENNK